ncbi:LOW QUALITY PROTEIN: succinate dehydrogenase cytochrome b-556 subunit [Vibrio sp. JCM 18904]|nr:LOW QUALITY PROTEIN: succinate dehydrogenase cytochrome b-556 subunit [Vibrio sp. JCM 18904]
MSKPVKERKSRPVNLDLQTIHFPITAIASILHRVSGGVITFVAVGILLWLLSISLSSPNGFYGSRHRRLLRKIHPVGGILTALAYHIAGGIRHLLMDLGHFEELDSGTMSAKVAFGATAVLSLLAGGILVW